MLYGIPVRTHDDIRRLRRIGFDFWELAFPNAAARRMWWESGVVNGGMGRLFFMAHGPLEDYPNDAGYLWNRYLPNLIATVDSLARMSIRSLNIHLSMDPQIVDGLVLVEKRRAVGQLVDYAQKYSVDINLENLSETADDLEVVLEEAPGLGLTLDVGHANLHERGNQSIAIIQKLGHRIRHVHLHDNHGGVSHVDDSHLAIGDGVVDFPAIVTWLERIGYDGTMTLEVKPDFQDLSRTRIKTLMEGIQKEQHIRKSSLCVSMRIRPRRLRLTDRTPVKKR